MSGLKDNKCSHPKEKEFHAWVKQLAENDPPVDGFDMAYSDGVNVVSIELAFWDGGISENYFRGIKDALAKLEE